MKRLTKWFGSVAAGFLTAILGLSAMATCVFVLHQPKMPETLNDFKKYDK